VGRLGEEQGLGAKVCQSTPAQKEGESGSAEGLKRLKSPFSGGRIGGDSFIPVSGDEERGLSGVPFEKF